MHPARLLLIWVPGPALALVLHALALNRLLPECHPVQLPVRISIMDMDHC
jgi:hypothetical protein